MAIEHLILGLELQIEWSLRSFFEDISQLVTLAGVLAVSQQQFIHAAKLLGAGHRSYVSKRAVLMPQQRVMIDTAVTETQAALDEEIFALAWEEGEAMDLDRALRSALQVVEGIKSHG